MADPSVCIVKDGKVVFYIEEERLTRIKHSHNSFPIKSIKESFKYLNISFNNIQAISYNWNFNKYQNGHMAQYFKKINKTFTVDAATKKWQIQRIKNRNLKNFEDKIKKNIFSEFGKLKIPKILFFSHHYVHAFQSFIHSGFKNAISISIDGSGEENCTTAWICNKDKIKLLEEINIPNSLGWYYSAFTEFLGFKAYDGEYKLMGLAAFGKKFINKKKTA